MATKKVKKPVKAKGMKLTIRIMPGDSLVKTIEDLKLKLDCKSASKALLLNAEMTVKNDYEEKIRQLNVKNNNLKKAYEGIRYLLFIYDKTQNEIKEIIQTPLNSNDDLPVIPGSLFTDGLKNNPDIDDDDNEDYNNNDDYDEDDI